MTMNRQQALGEASFCLRSAESVNDPEYRNALLELAEWWNQQAEWPSESAPNSSRNVGYRRSTELERFRR